MECASCFGTLLYGDLTCTRKFCTTCRCRDISHANLCACGARETGAPLQGKAKRKRASVQKNVLSPNALALYQSVSGLESSNPITTESTTAYFEFSSAHFCPLPGCRATDCAIMQNNDGRLRSKKYFIIARAVKQCVDGLVELFACNCDADGLQLQLLLLNSQDINTTAMCKEAHSSSNTCPATRQMRHFVDWRVRRSTQRHKPKSVKDRSKYFSAAPRAIYCKRTRLVHVHLAS